MWMGFELILVSPFVVILVVVFLYLVRICGDKVLIFPETTG